MRPENFSRQPWSQVQTTMEPCPVNLEPNLSNQGPSPDNHETNSRQPWNEYRKPGTFSRQQWNWFQLTRTRKIRATRNLHQATTEPSSEIQEVNPGNQEPSPVNCPTKSKQPGTRYRQPQNLHQAIMEKSSGNQEVNPCNWEPWPGNHGTKSSAPGTESEQSSPDNYGTKSRQPGTFTRELESESRPPGTFCIQPWNQFQHTRNWIQATTHLHQETIEPSPGKQKVNRDHQETSAYNHGTNSSRPETESRQPTRHLHQETMEPSPGNQEVNPHNQEPSPVNRLTMSRQPETGYRQPETITRQPWNKVQAFRKWIQ